MYKCSKCSAEQDKTGKCAKCQNEVVENDKVAKAQESKSADHSATPVKGA